MKVSVVIPCLNEQARIGPAIDSARDAGADEIIVADGGSSDDTLRIARDRAVTVVSSAAGRAVQMNAAAETASGDVLLFLHADCRLPQGAAELVGRSLEDGKNSWGAFRQRIDSFGWIFRAIERGNEARVRWQRLAYGDQGIFVRRTTFMAVGKFDPVPLLEDVLLSRKLARTGRPVLIDGPLVVDPRRWRKYGPVRQTMRNWWLMGLFRLGVSPERLAEYYRRHHEK